MLLVTVNFTDLMKLAKDQSVVSLMFSTMKCRNMETILLYENVLNHAMLHTHCASVCYSVEMMGHPDLRSECDINQLEPLLHQDVVDDLLSKYVKTFTVNIYNTYICCWVAHLLT